MALLVAGSPASSEPSRGRFESLLAFTLNGATLGDVVERLGSARRFEVPGSHLEFAICYELRGTGTIVMFSSDHEFGGPEAELLGVSVLKQGSETFPCSSLAMASEVVSLDGVTLGMTEPDFRTVVGEPVRPVDNGDLVRRFESERQLSADELEELSASFPGVGPRVIADVMHSVWGRFENGRLIAFGCWRFETF